MLKNMITCNLMNNKNKSWKKKLNIMMENFNIQKIFLKVVKK